MTGAQLSVFHWLEFRGVGLDLCFSASRLFVSPILLLLIQLPCQSSELDCISIRLLDVKLVVWGWRWGVGVFFFFFLSSGNKKSSLWVHCVISAAPEAVFAWSMSVLFLWLMFSHSQQVSERRCAEAYQQCGVGIIVVQVVAVRLWWAGKLGCVERPTDGSCFPHLCPAIPKADAHIHLCVDLFLIVICRSTKDPPECNNVSPERNHVMALINWKTFSWRISNC